MVKRTIPYRFLIIAVLVMLLGCSTTKNTFMTRTYHNVNAKYNAYFNGNESMKQSIKKIDRELVDNYSIMLPVFLHSSKEAASLVSSGMDHSIEKASKVIRMHSITSKPKRQSGAKTDKQKAFYARKEFCNWVDDSYLMMGKAQFYKHDYYLAIQSFEYVIKEYNNMPIRFDGMIWLARTHMELENYQRAQEMLDQIDGEKDFPESLMDEYYSSYADFWMKQARYDMAIPHLQDAIKATHKKIYKARYKYILAQIYQQNGDAANASKLYGEVVKLNPTYEMAFSAKINRATSFDAGAGDSKEIKKQLTKMLKDDKNIEYQDQIYYALGNISYKEGKKEVAIDYYVLSIQKSVDNEDQKALSYLALADIYYIKPVYPAAQAYFDSSFVLLNENYPRYDEVKNLSKNLTELVGYITTVEFEDSVQKVAKLPKADRDKMIADIIQKLKDDEAREAASDRERHLKSAMFEQDQRMDKSGNTTGKWYFYNPQAVALGKTQFATKWGSRKNEDNWRRKNKAIVEVNLGEEDLAAGIDSTLLKETDNKKPEFYLQDLPVTDSLLALSHERIENSLYKLAQVYKDKFKDYPMAIETYDELNKRYPENVYILATYYDLYQIYTKLDNKQKADYYKNLLIDKFPDSKYAKILTNPNYFKELEASRNVINNLYTETYTAFKTENYAAVISNSDKAIKEYDGSKLIPKFLFLRAMAKGESGDLVSMKKELQYIVDFHSESEVKPAAWDVLSAATGGAIIREAHTDSVAKAEEKLQAEAEELFKFVDKSKHFYVTVVDERKIDANRLKFTISNYNFDVYSEIDFEVESQLFSDKKQILQVKSFGDKDQAFTYYKSIISNNTVYKDIKASDYVHFIITPENLKSLLADKDTGKYLKFFAKYYLAE